MSVKLLTEHHLEILSLKGGRTASSESTLVKIPHCWKSHVAAQCCNESFISSGARHITGLRLMRYKDRIINEPMLERLEEDTLENRL